MYRWYEDAMVCFAYLADVSFGRLNGASRPAWQESFQRCRWLQRGWTLQEFIAPKRVEFYAYEDYLADKASLCQLLQDATGIGAALLSGEAPLSAYPFMTRLEWAKSRQTTRPEDLIYSLMGICDVVIDVYYGEGWEKARARLEREIRTRHGEVAIEIRAPPNAIYLQSVNPNGASGQAASCNVEETRRQKLKRLQLDTIDSRRETIKNAHGKTCAWILKHACFLQWMEQNAVRDHSGFFWIKGKSGAGKSVLIKYLDFHVSTESEKSGDIVIPFYVTARGDTLEKSLVGMCRSLLSQLLRANKVPQVVLDDEGVLKSESEITVAKLQRLFHFAALKVRGRRLICFIDALDECHEDHVQQMIDFFQDLSQGAVEHGILVHVCFASRHYPTLTTLTGLQLVLEKTGEHRNDLEQHISTQKFQSGGTGRVESILKTVQHEILERANHVFLWAVLVVEILNKEYQKGRIHAVESRLRELPQGLSKLFQTIILRDQDDMIDFRLCLKWLLYARRPLSLREFYYAMMAGLGDQTLEYTPNMTDDIMQSYLLTSSKGIAELTRESQPRAQFIHESVRDFLFSDDAAEILAGDSYADPYQSHELLKQCCMKGIVSDYDGRQQETMKICEYVNTAPTFRPSIPKSKMIKLLESLPFLEYATECIFFHADKAEAHISQRDYLQTWLNCNVLKWTTNHNHIVQDEADILRTVPNLFFVFAVEDCPRLIQNLFSHAYSPWPHCYHRYRSPLFAAIAKRGQVAARVLLQQENAENIEEIIQEVMADNYRLAKCDTFDAGRGSGVESEWEWALQHQCISLLRHHLRRGIDRTRLDQALLKSAELGTTRIASLLLREGANVNVQNDRQRSALEAAVRLAAADMAKLLLSNGADVNAQNRYGESALQTAVLLKRMDMVGFLLLNGADVNAQEDFYGSALQVAVYTGYVEMVEFLLLKGANVNAKGGWYGNALQAAVHRGRLEVAKLLLRKNADVNGKGGAYKHALRAAVVDGNVEMVRFLLRNRANISVLPGRLRHALLSRGLHIWTPGIIERLILEDQDTVAWKDGD